MKRRRIGDPGGVKMPGLDRALRRLAAGDPIDRLLARIRARDGPFAHKARSLRGEASILDDDEAEPRPGDEWGGWDRNDSMGPVLDGSPSSLALDEVVETGAPTDAPPARPLPDDAESVTGPHPEPWPEAMPVERPRVGVRQSRWKI